MYRLVHTLKDVQEDNQHTPECCCTAVYTPVRACGASQTGSLWMQRLCTCSPAQVRVCFYLPTFMLKLPFICPSHTWKHWEKSHGQTFRNAYAFIAPSTHKLAALSSPSLAHPSTPHEWLQQHRESRSWLGAVEAPKCSPWQPNSPARQSTQKWGKEKEATDNQESTQIWVTNSPKVTQMSLWQNPVSSNPIPHKDQPPHTGAWLLSSTYVFI